MLLLLLCTPLSLQGSFHPFSALLGDLWPTPRLRFPGCSREEMRETKLSVRPDGNYHPAAQGVIISLMQYVPSFSDMLTSSRLLFPSPDFPGCHSLLSLKCQLCPRALTALLKPPRCCQNVLEEPDELSTSRYQANGLCTGQLHFFGQGGQAAWRAESVAAVRAAGELRGLCPVLQQGPRTVPKPCVHMGRTAGMKRT